MTNITITSISAKLTNRHLVNAHFKDFQLCPVAGPVCLFLVLDLVLVMSRHRENSGEPIRLLTVSNYGQLLRTYATSFEINDAIVDGNCIHCQPTIEQPLLGATLCLNRVSEYSRG